MTADLWNIFLNIVAAFIYAGLVWLWQNRGSQPFRRQAQPLRSPATTPPVTSNDRRQQNRHALTRTAQKFLFYFVTFGVLYLSVTMPPLFKALFTKQQILLSDARFIGDLLPSIPIEKSHLQLTFFVIAAVFYLPLLAAADLLTSLVCPIIDSLLPMTERIWSVTTMLFFFLFCIPMAATSIWLFFEKSFQDSLITVGIALFLVFALGQAQGERR